MYHVTPLVVIAMMSQQFCTILWKSQNIDNCLNVYLHFLSNVTTKAEKNDQMDNELYRTSKSHTYSHSCCAVAPLLSCFQRLQKDPDQWVIDLFNSVMPSSCSCLEVTRAMYFRICNILVRKMAILLLKKSTTFPS